MSELDDEGRGKFSFQNLYLFNNICISYAGLHTRSEKVCEISRHILEMNPDLYPSIFGLVLSVSVKFDVSPHDYSMFLSNSEQQECRCCLK